MGEEYNPAFKLIDACFICFAAWAIKGITGVYLTYFLEYTHVIGGHALL